MTAAKLYKNYLIVSHAKQNSASARWSVTVDISSRVTGRRNETIYRRDQFDSREEAEEWGMEQARAWIDQRV